MQNKFLQKCLNLILFLLSCNKITLNYVLLSSFNFISQGIRTIFNLEFERYDALGIFKNIS